MSSRGATRVGAVVAVLAAAGLAVYFLVVGLDKADKLASVLGVFLGLAGLALSIYASRAGRTITPPAAGVPADSRDSAAGQTVPAAPEPGHGQGRGQGGVVNEIRGGIFHDTVIQAGSIGGSVSFGIPPSAAPPPSGGNSPDSGSDLDSRPGG